jgi:hypothetical protein
VWSREIDGKVLRFRLAGINNQNFLMADEETGSWWQQVSGKAIHGPLAGRRLTLAPHGEVTFALFRQEHPRGQVLRPEESAPWRRFSEGWEEGTAKLPVPAVLQAGPLPPRELVVGIAAGGEAMAFPFADLARTSPIVGQVGEVPIALVLASDGRSVRAFDRRLEGRTLELYAKAGEADRLIDAETGSTWDLRGRGVAGPLAGKALERLPALKDYWFDWKAYNPKTGIYAHGR